MEPAGRGETGLHSTAGKQAPIPPLLPAPHSKASGAAFPGKNPAKTWDECALLVGLPLPKKFPRGCARQTNGDLLPASKEGYPTCLTSVLPRLQDFPHRPAAFFLVALYFVTRQKNESCVRAARGRQSG